MQRWQTRVFDALLHVPFLCMVLVCAGDEHGNLLWPQGNWHAAVQLPPIGTKLLLQPGHCDPTVNLYDCIVAFRKQHGVVGVWPVARGPGL